MNQLRLQFPVEVLTRILGISRSGFYARQGRPPSLRSKNDAIFKPLIVQAHKVGRSTYGSARIQQELADQEVYVGRDHIHRLRKELGLRCVQNKKFKATTNSAHDLPVAPNLLEQKFEVEGPGKVYDEPFRQDSFLGIYKLIPLLFQATASWNFMFWKRAA